MPILDGETDSLHQSVVAVTVLTEQFAALCTGTLIAPNLILTARHCIAPTPSRQVVCGQAAFGPPYPPSNIFFAFDTVLSPQTSWLTIKEVMVPSGPGDVCGSDLALLVTDALVPESIAMPSIPRIDFPAQPLESYMAVGYGVATDGQGDTGTRRMRDDLEISCGTGACGSGVTGAEFIGEVGVCQGDSGGPALGPNRRVLGVASRGGDGCTTPVYSAVNAWSEFVIEGAYAASVAGGYDPMPWVLTGQTSDIGETEDLSTRELELAEARAYEAGCSVALAGPDKSCLGAGLVGLLAGLMLHRRRRAAERATVAKWPRRIRMGRFW